MSESEQVIQKKKGLIRYVIEKHFCFHNYEEIYKRETKNQLGNVVEINAVRECTICGKSKKIVL